MHHRFLGLLLLIASVVSGADTDVPVKPMVPVGVIIHDLRDFLPEAESAAGHADDPIPGFSTKPGAIWSNYRSYNTNGTGYLSRTEIQAIVSALVSMLRNRYPDEYAAIDTDGHETITNAKIQAYLHRHP